VEIGVGDRGQSNNSMDASKKLTMPIRYWKAALGEIGVSEIGVSEIGRSGDRGRRSGSE
jgi:hypothetical protein